MADHEGMGTPKITRWIAQFDDDDIPLAVKILHEVKYFSTENIRSMIHALVGLTYDHFSPIAHDRILFIPIGVSYEGSSIVARALRDEIGEDRIRDMTDLEDLAPETFDALVFLDDFSGTGKTLKTWWSNVESIVKPRNVPFTVALLILNCRARSRIERFANVICVNELNQNQNILSPESPTFTQAEKDKIVDYCHRTGCPPRFLLGFGKCGLLVAFKHLCPNNSLPILWHECDAPLWEALFRRSGL